MIKEKQKENGDYQLISSFLHKDKNTFWCIETKCADRNILYRASLLFPGVEVCALKFKNEINTIRLYITFMGEGSTEISYSDIDDNCVKMSFAKIEYALHRAIVQMSIHSYEMFKLRGGKVN